MIPCRQHLPISDSILPLTMSNGCTNHWAIKPQLQSLLKEMVHLSNSSVLSSFRSLAALTAEATLVHALYSNSRRMNEGGKTHMAYEIDQQYLLHDQYKNAANLRARIELHRRFSTSAGWYRWVFDQYRIAASLN